jgi:chromosome segregation ATPase
MAELEALVERLESETRDSASTHAAQLTSNREVLVSKENRIASLEDSLSAALAQTSALQSQLAELNKTHGAALALRDGRVSELRLEIDRINEALRTAHETVRILRVEKGNAEERAQEEKKKAREMVEGMRAELQRVVQMGQDFVHTPKKAVSLSISAPRAGSSEPADRIPSSPLARGAIVRKGGMLSGELARRGSGKRTRRRYDSGLGFLDEDEVDM